LVPNLDVHTSSICTCGPLLRFVTEANFVEEGARLAKLTKTGFGGRRSFQRLSNQRTYE